MTGKYTPVKQWLHHETFEMMSTIPKQISNNRYHDYSILFGEQYINKILNAHVFVVGAGALGC